MSSADDFLLDDEEDVRTIEFIKNYLPQELKGKFSDDDLYYIIDLIAEYYVESGILDQDPDDEGFINIDQDAIVSYIMKEAEKNQMGPYDSEDIFFVVQGEMEYGNTIGEVE